MGTIRSAADPSARAAERSMYARMRAAAASADASIAFDDDHGRAGDRERVRDARAHAPAAEHPDPGRRAHRSLRFCEERRHAPQLLRALEQLGLQLELDGGMLLARRPQRALGVLGWRADRCARSGRRGRARQPAARPAGCSDETSPHASASSASRMRPVSSSVARAGLADDLAQPPRGTGGGHDAEARSRGCRCAARGVPMRRSAA